MDINISTRERVNHQSGTREDIGNANVAFWKNQEPQKETDISNINSG